MISYLDDEAEDPKLKQLWSFISRKIYSLSLKTRVDTTEESVGIIEEIISTNNDNIANEFADRLNGEFFYYFQHSGFKGSFEVWFGWDRKHDEGQVAVPFEISVIEIEFPIFFQNKAKYE